jgi:signal transduction histidine kinase
VIRSWRVWVAVSACLFLALAGVVALSAFALRLDRADRQARQSAAREENARLALWRLDSDLLPLVARESAVAAEAYGPVFPARGVLDARRQPLPEGTAFVASPLLSYLPEHVLLHFQVAPDGTVSSPQVVDAGLRASMGVPPAAEVAVLEQRLGELKALLRGTDLRGALTAPPLQARRPAPRSEPATTLADVSQMAKNVSEFSARTRSASQAVRRGPGNSNAYQEDFVLADASPLPGDGDAMRAVFVGKALLLGRRVRLDGQEYLQGCWLDWQAMRPWLLGQIQDLLPQAELVPVHGPAAQGDSRLLAALPVRLMPGPVSSGGHDTASISSLPVVLTVAWSGVLLAGVAVVALLVGVVALSERRGAFVSAVTHELRTPLTTFRMYTEMLAAGMVPDAARRQEYFDILHREAERLSHLVENVLAYARIERGRAPARLERVPVDRMLQRMEERLAQRAAQAGMELCVDVPAGLAVLTDPSAVEQVLFNLVDNASKYAAPAVDRRIHVEVELRRGRVGLAVRDHGPGVDAATARRLFEPFSKSVQTAAKTAPGVGLGLALCRRLARSMRADLRHERVPGGGARFVLWLPPA